jgi:hypothetical protein
MYASGIMRWLKRRNKLVKDANQINPQILHLMRILGFHVTIKHPGPQLPARY